jgi:GTP-dependent phosphoenolpyruvate carboxykinase
MKTMKKESIFKVTFTNDSDIFIKAMDEGHARRIVEKAGKEWLAGETTIEMIVKKIEKVEG